MELKTNNRICVITSKSKIGSFNLYINDNLHLSISKNELVGIQSWVENAKYSIEYYLKDKDIITEYDDIEKWKTILKILDKENLI